MNNVSVVFSDSDKKGTVYGVGYNGEGTHLRTLNGISTPEYKTWQDMLRRCYSPEFKNKNPTYADCTVDSDWHDFQVFADWLDAQPYKTKGYHLDKDILVPGNKKYSPENCCLIPQEINKLLVSHASRRGKYPQGVYFDKSSGKFKSGLKICGKYKNLGSFDSPNEAYCCYKRSKENHIKNEAMKWKDKIEPKVFSALIGYSL